MSKWTDDVRSLLKTHILGRKFTTEEFWQECEIELRKKHPNNNNLRPKIRQQFQILRDKGELRQGKHPGEWVKVSKALRNPQFEDPRNQRMAYGRPLHDS